MGIAGGSGPDMSDHLADLGLRRRRMARRSLAALRPYFATDGRVELHGCEVRRGRFGSGLIQELSSAFGVPVSAGVRTQFAGGASTFRFEDPVRTAYPGGK